MMLVTSLLSVFLLLLEAFGSNASPTQSESGTECGQARSSYLWRIDRQPAAYLLGTIHVPYTAVWDSLSPGVLSVLASVQSVHPELDLARPGTAAELAKCQLIADPATQLEDLLPPGMVDRVANYLSSMRQRLSEPGQAAALSAQISGWRRRRPMWLALSLASLTPADLSAFGTELMDVHLTRRAASRGQLVEPLESAQDQCRPLNAVPADEAALALRLTLDHLERRFGRLNDRRLQPTDRLVGDYRCGLLGADVVNASFLPDEAVAGLSGSDATLYQRLTARLRRSLMCQRNRRMAERIEQRLRLRPATSQLFAVGVGHLLGNRHSIVAHLRSLNFSIRLLAWNETEPGLGAWDSSNQPTNKLPNYPSSVWRYPNAESQADRQIWEEAKRFARQKWEQLKAERLGQEPASPSSSASGNHLINLASTNYRRSISIPCISMTILTLLLRNS